VSALLTASSWVEVDLESLLPDIRIAAHPEQLLTYRRDEAEAAASAHRRRALRRAQAAERSRSPCTALTEECGSGTEERGQRAP
jgi:hypothetical protein